MFQTSWKIYIQIFYLNKTWKRKCIFENAFQRCGKRFEMEHVNNKVLQILCQHKGVVSWLRTW
jgi:hypothetical protein